VSKYEIGDLIEASVWHQGELKRFILTYVPDDTDDFIHWRALVPNSTPGGGWFADNELSDIVPMIAVPRYGRRQVVDALDLPLYTTDAIPEIADEVLRLMGQPVQEDDE
jgi:hypothetical protein